MPHVSHTTPDHLHNHLHSLLWLPIILIKTFFFHATLFFLLSNKPATLLTLHYTSCLPLFFFFSFFFYLFFKLSNVFWFWRRNNAFRYALFSVASTIPWYHFSNLPAQHVDHQAGRKAQLVASENYSSLISNYASIISVLQIANTLSRSLRRQKYLRVCPWISPFFITDSTSSMLLL